MADTHSRKRTRYCQHCDKNVNYQAYKRHKEEFYDSDEKEWAKCHATVEEDLDVKDDETICNALGNCGTDIILTSHCYYV